MFRAPQPEAWDSRYCYRTKQQQQQRRRRKWDHTNTHAHTHTRARAHAHICTHAHLMPSYKHQHMPPPSTPTPNFVKISPSTNDVHMYAKDSTGQREEQLTELPLDQRGWCEGAIHSFARHILCFANKTHDFTSSDRVFVSFCFFCCFCFCF